MEPSNRQIFAWLWGFSLVTPPGLEPGTNGLKVHCSAIELESLRHWSWQGQILPRSSLISPEIESRHWVAHA